MNVEAYLRAQIPGYPFSTDVLESAVVSPLFAKPKALRGLDLSMEIVDVAESESATRSLKYAISTLYYAISGVFSGGSKSEQVGDVKVSTSGYTVTQADRENLRKMADNIRSELGCDIEANPNVDGGIFDATPLTRR